VKKIIFLLLIPIIHLFPSEQVIELGGRLWNLYDTENIEMIKNKNSSVSLFLKESEYSADNNTLLLLHFNEKREYDSTGRFEIGEKGVPVSGKIKKLGKGAGFFNGGEKPVVLNSVKEGFFPDRVYSGDFSVEFWLYTQNASDGETIFLYENYTDTGKIILPQLFRCYIEDRKVFWQMKNLFLPEDKKPFNLLINGKKRLIPKKWSHHVIRYKAEQGILEYLIDGIPEAVEYVNREGNEAGGSYPFYSGKRSRIVMGENFTGALDEFRIKSEWINNFNLSRFDRLEGYFNTGMIDLKHSKSEVFSVECLDNVPEGTDINYHYILSDSPENPDINSPMWKILPMGKVRISGGRFLFIKGTLFSDGEKQISPSVNRINIKYDERRSPPPPSMVKAELSDRKLKLRWSDVPDTDIDGYLVYIGEKPGKYFGTGKINSPIDAGLSNSMVIDNLENGRIYYIAVLSYYNTASSVGSIIKKGGIYSKEISARPSISNR